MWQSNGSYPAGISILKIHMLATHETTHETGFLHTHSQGTDAAMVVPNMIITEYNDTWCRTRPSQAYGVAQDGLPTVHQTRGNQRLTIDEYKWRESWSRLGFPIRTADDEQARRDIARMQRIIYFPALSQMFDALDTNTQRSDVWRYVILWLDGGIYADTDVVAHFPLVEFVRSHTTDGALFSESLAVFDYLPRTLSRALCKGFRSLGLTDLVRLPQRRNCIIIAHAGCPLMLRTLRLIAERFIANTNKSHLPEPERTLELTGPGIFTDAIDELSHECGGLAGGFHMVHRFRGMSYIQHIGTGKWKTYRVSNGGLQPHEGNLLCAVLALNALVLFVVAVACKRHRIRLFAINHTRLPRARSNERVVRD